MKRIPIAFESYIDDSIPVSAKRLVNLFAEKKPDDARARMTLVPTHGLARTPWQFGAGPILAINNDFPGITYILSGTHFYALVAPLNAPAFITDLGDVGSTGGEDYAWNLMPTIAVGVNAVVVCVPPRAYTAPHTLTPVNQIGGTFPGARSVAYLDGYFVFTNDDMNAQFFVSLLLDPNNYDALDFAYADGVPNIVRRVMVLRDELWLLGDKGLEVWYNAGSSGLETTAGTSFFPFRRRSGAIITHAIGSVRSAAMIDGSMFWVTDTGMVMRSNGYAAVRISTHAIEAIIRDYGIPKVHSALTYVKDGHSYYVLNLLGRTLVYDGSTQLWHERSSSTDGTAAWMASCVGLIGDVVIFGSELSGWLFNAESNLATEDGQQVLRLMMTPPLWADANRAFCSRVEVEMQVGGPTPAQAVQLYWSDDGGYTFQGPRQLGSADPSRRRRAVATRLGSFRSRSFMIQAGEPIWLYAMDVDIAAGIS